MSDELRHRLRGMGDDVDVPDDARGAVQARVRRRRAARLAACSVVVAVLVGIAAVAVASGDDERTGRGPHRRDDRRAGRRVQRASAILTGRPAPTEPRLALDPRTRGGQPQLLRDGVDRPRAPRVVGRGGQRVERPAVRRRVRSRGRAVARHRRLAVRRSIRGVGGLDRRRDARVGRVVRRSPTTTVRAWPTTRGTDTWRELRRRRPRPRSSRRRCGPGPRWSSSVEPVAGGLIAEPTAIAYDPACDRVAAVPPTRLARPTATRRRCGPATR